MNLQKETNFPKLAMGGKWIVYYMKEFICKKNVILLSI